MNHKDLSIKKRYILFFLILFCLLFIGTTLLKFWNQTPETHFINAIRLLEKNDQKEALKHLILAQKSQEKTIKKMSSAYLGYLYHHGSNEIPVNMDKAIFYYEEAATLNSKEALYTLALLYDAGDKVPENRDKAKEYMLKASEELPDAQYAIAVWIERGYFGKPDTQKAVNLYEKAAHAGVQNAIKSLISIYHGGFGGFPTNIQKENYWRKKLK